jgi:cobalt-zinc-cadmium efflux system protein
VTHTHPHAHVHAAPNSAAGRLLVALGVTLAFVGVEALGGWRANSLALLTDAAHNLTDVLALALSWFALRLTTRPAHAGQTYGYHRAGILAALANSITLIVVVGGVFYEAYRRLTHPPVVEEHILIGVAILAFGVNAGTAWLVMSGSRHDLNLRSIFVHLASDAVSTLGAGAAGVGIALTGLQILDPLVSFLIGGLILWNAVQIIRETVHILLQGTPRDVDLPAMTADLLSVNGVRGVHDLHVWSLTQEVRVLSAHVLTEDMPVSAGACIQNDLRAMLQKKYGIGHATLQLECEVCEPGCNLTAVSDDH